MEHVTALVDHDATTPFTCSCMKLRAAGWLVVCRACGHGVADRPALAVVAELGYAEVLEQVAVWTPDVDDEDYDVERDDRLVGLAEGRVA